MARKFLRRKRLLAVLAVVVVLVFVVVPAGIAYAALHPERCSSTATPRDYGMDYESASVKTGDGVELRGWVIPAGDNGKHIVVVIMHGYTSCKASPGILEVASRLHERGYDIVMFDFRGHGESGGTTTIGPVEAVEDAPAIIGYARERFPGEKVVLLGYSMGGAVAIVAGITNNRADAIIADSPYPTLKVVIPRWLKAKMGVPEWYSSIIGFYGSLITGQDLDFGPALAPKFDTPLLVIAGDRDPLLRPEEAAMISEKSSQGAIIIVDGAGHVEAAEILGVDEYVDRIDGFISWALGGS